MIMMELLLFAIHEVRGLKDSMTESVSRSQDLCNYSHIDYV